MRNNPRDLRDGLEMTGRIDVSRIIRNKYCETIAFGVFLVMKQEKKNCQ
jgi:hypothetical protein